MKITFFTTSTFSDVQQVQSAAIKKIFPESNHHLIDGRQGWFLVWYRWLEMAKSIQSDWYIHIDEDCFLTSDVEILKLIDYMNQNNIDIAGCPDGHFEYRSGNHLALNSFFMIMNRKCIDTWFSRTETPQFQKEWIEDYPHTKKNHSHYEYNMEFGSSGKPLGIIWKPETEPYYDFMWVLKKGGCKFYYLEPHFGNDFQTTNLLNDTIIHMWHQRERWSNNIVSPLHKLPNKLRFDQVMMQITKNVIMDETSKSLH